MGVAPIYFVVHGQPCSVNRCYRRARWGRMFMSPEGKAWKLRVSEAARKAMNGHLAIDGPCIVRMAFFYQSRRSDLDGGLKPTLDALQPHAIVNDRQVVELHLAKGLDKEMPRVEIQIEVALNQDSPRPRRKPVSAVSQNASHGPTGRGPHP